MTIDKNKKISRTGKNSKKRNIDPFEKKVWIPVKSPNSAGNIVFGVTIVDKITASNKSIEKLKNRKFEISLADLTKKEELSYRKFKFKCIDYSNGNCFTGFNGLDLTRDKFSSLIKKWHTIVESCLDLKTKDGFYLRIFIVAFSKKLKNQIKKFAYLQSSQIRSVRRKIEQIVTREGLLSTMKDLIGKINSEKINEEIKKVCSRIFPLQNIFIKKVKVIQRPVDSKD